MPSLQIAANLLFLPLLGGYLVLVRFYWTRHVTARTHGPRLLLHSSVVGLMLIAAARGLQLFSANYQSHGLVESLALWTLLPAAWTLLLVGLAAVAVKRWTRAAAVESQTASEEGAPGEPVAQTATATATDESSDRELKERIGIVLVGGLLTAPVLAIADRSIALDAVLGGWSFWVLLLAAGLVGLHWRWATNYMADLSWQSMALRGGLFLTTVALAVVAVGRYSSTAHEWWAGFLGVKLGTACEALCPTLGEVIDPRGLGLATTALAIGLSLPPMLNLLMPRPMAVGRFYRRDDVNSLERLLFEVSTDWDNGDRSALLQITCADNKVYVGFVRRLPPDPSFKDAFLEILPVYSGYRDKDTRTVTFTTLYEEFFDWLLEDKTRDLGDYFKVIPISTICAASRFDPDVYLRFQIDDDREATAPKDPN